MKCKDCGVADGHRFGSNCDPPPLDIELLERAFRDGYEAGFADAEGNRIHYREDDAAIHYRNSLK